MFSSLPTIISALRDVRKLLYIRRSFAMSSTQHYPDIWSDLVGTDRYFPVNISQIVLGSVIEMATQIRASVGRSSNTIREIYEKLPAKQTPLKRLFGESLKAADSIVKTLDNEISERVRETNNIESVAGDMTEAIEHIEALDKTIAFVESIIGEGPLIINSDDGTGAADGVISKITSMWESDSGDVLETSDTGDNAEMDSRLNTHAPSKRELYVSESNPYLSDPVPYSTLTGMEGLESLMNDPVNSPMNQYQP